jgi:hypothetical protein
MGANQMRVVVSVFLFVVFGLAVLGGLVTLLHGLSGSAADFAAGVPVGLAGIVAGLIGALLVDMFLNVSIIADAQSELLKLARRERDDRRAVRRQVPDPVNFEYAADEAKPREQTWLDDMGKCRTWTTAKGARKMDAKFGGLATGTVTLIKRDGATIQVPLEKLSEADQEWINEEMAAR